MVLAVSIQKNLLNDSSKITDQTVISDINIENSKFQTEHSYLIMLKKVITLQGQTPLINYWLLRGLKVC